MELKVVTKKFKTIPESCVYIQFIFILLAVCERHIMHDKLR